MKSTPADPNASLVTIVDRSQGDQGLLLSFEVSDGTGFASAEFRFEVRDTDGNLLGSVYTSASEWSSLSNGSDASNGRHVVMLELPATATEGAYELSSFTLSDQAGNEGFFQRNPDWSSTAKAALGIDPASLSFSLTGSIPDEGGANNDSELPVISNIALADQWIDRSSGEHGTLFSFNATDETGFRSLSLSFETRDSNGQWLDSVHGWASTWSALVSGSDSKNETYLGLIEPAITAPEGAYELSYFSVHDEAGNSEYFGRDFIEWQLVNGLYTPVYGWSDTAIAVLGTNPDTLNFRISGTPTNINKKDNELPSIQNIRLSDNWINIDAGETGTLLLLEISDSTGLDEARFSFSLAGSPGYGPDSFSVGAHLWSSLVQGGTEQQGAHVLQIEIPPSARPGIYELSHVSLTDQAGNWDGFSRKATWSGSGYGTGVEQAWDEAAVAALGFNPEALTFTVANDQNIGDGGDRQLPVISNISLITPETNDQTVTRAYKSGEIVTFELELADDGVGLDNSNTSGSGYSSPTQIGYVTFRSPQGLQTLHHSLNSADRISGDANQGVYRISFSLDASHEPGEWTMTDLYLTDINGNNLSVERQYGSGSWDSPVTALQRAHLATRLGVDPADLSFIHINPEYAIGPGSGQDDDQPPIVTGFSLEMSESNDPRSWSAYIDLEDTGVGLATSSGSGYGSNSWIGNLIFRSPDGRQTIYSSIDSSNRVSGDSQVSSYRVDLPLDETHQPGQWTMTSLSIQDVSGNQLLVQRQSNGSGDGAVTELQRAQIAGRLGLTPESLSFAYINSTYESDTKDINAPELTAFSFYSDSQTEANTWTARLSLTDGSGLGRNSGDGDSIGHLEFLSADGQQEIYTPINSSDRVSGDAKNGMYDVVLPLDRTHQPGEWILSDIYVEDIRGNRLSVRRQQNSGNGSTPFTQLQKEHIAARLGLTPEALSFTYSNPLYNPNEIDITSPKLLSLKWSPSGNQLPQPSTPDLEAASDSGSSDTDNITNATTPTITGVATPGSTISWLLDGVLYPANTAITTADPQTGEWSYTLPAEHAATADSDYTLTVIATDADGNVSAPSDPLVITIDLTAPTFNSSLEASSIGENSGSGQIVYTASASDTHEVLYSLKGDEPFEIDPLTGSVRMMINPDYETQAAHSFTVVATDVAGNSAEQQVSLAVLDKPEAQAVTLSIPDVVLQPGKVASIPINVDEAKGIESIDLTLAYDPAVFQLPQNGELITASALSAGGTWEANTSTPGQIVLSWSGIAQLPAGAGALGAINLEVSADAQPGTSPLLEMTAALVSEGLIPSNLSNGNTTIVAPSFQVLNVRHTPNGLALRLSEAPDMATFNLYDGKDAAVDAPDLELRGADGKAVALSAHWQAEELELHLLAANALGAGEYTLTIAARNDGLVSAASGEVLDGNGDGINGDNYVLSFSRQGDEPFLAVANTARGGGQALSLNGDDFRDGLTGLPVLLSSSEALRSLSGSFVFNAEHFLNADLRAGSALPDDWVLTIDAASGAGRIVYSAGGNSTISGNNLELFRFDALVAPETTDKAVYGSTALIEATATATRADNTNLELDTDPGLVALAYSGDATGDGTLSSMDALRVQRTVVGLDSGFDAYDDINPTLIGDTTGNGTLSSLDAARIQQQVVGMSVDSFPKNPI